MRSILPGLCLICIFTFFSAGSHAQTFSINWGAKARLKYDFDDAVSLSNGNFIVLKLEEKGGGMFSRAKVIRHLMLVDKTGETLNETPLDLDESVSTGKGLEKYGNNIFYMYNTYDKDNKTTTLYAIKIDEKTMAMSDKISLGVFESDSRSDQADVSFKLSSDSSRLMVFAEGPDRKKENEKFYIGVFDTNLKKLWSRDAELDINQRYVSLYDEDITNDGQVYVAIKHYDKEVTRERVKENGEKIPSYTYQLLKYSDGKSKQKEISFNLDNKFIEGTKLIYDKKGNITVAGLYKQKYNGRITGVFYTSIDPAVSEVKNPKMEDFPGDLISLVDKDGFGSDGKSDPGLYQHFKIRHILARDNGSVDLVAEYYRLDIRTYYNAQSHTTTTTYYYYYGDVVNTNIDKTGKAVFTRVPKNQKFANATLFMGFFPLVYKDKLVLLFNDDKDNIDRDLSKAPDDVMKFNKSALVAATINDKGVLSRESIYDNDDEDYVVLPRNTSRIDDHTYLISSDLIKMFKKRTRFGVLTIK